MKKSCQVLVWTGCYVHLQWVIQASWIWFKTQYLWLLLMMIGDLSLQVKEMFYHAFDNYMRHAFPLDELRPMSCTGEDSLGSYSLTLVMSLYFCSFSWAFLQKMDLCLLAFPVFLVHIQFNRDCQMDKWIVCWNNTVLKSSVTRPCGWLISNLFFFTLDGRLMHWTCLHCWVIVPGLVKL